MIPLTTRSAAEIVSHEAIVQEAYRDSVGVWTWGPGITNASGHGVMRYKDNPQTLERCLAVYEWLLRTKYVPAVQAEFAGHDLTEAQLAAAVSFHWNTGAIARASWVDLWKAGHVSAARTAIMDWVRPESLRGRRTAERDLFFGGKWSGDGRCTVYQVRKPSYTPDWRSARRVDIMGPLQEVFQ